MGISEGERDTISKKNFTKFPRAQERFEFSDQLCDWESSFKLYLGNLVEIFVSKQKILIDASQVSLEIFNSRRQ